MSESSKAILTKILAILGFCVTVALIIWLIITLIGRAPGAFSSLANIADGINLRKELTKLDVTLEKGVVNSGEPFEISWTDTKHDGTYRLGYACTEGMTIFFKDPEGTFRPMRCGEQLLSLPTDITSLGLVASSTKDRFTDVTFRVLFSESTTTPPLEGTAKLTVVNASIPVGGGTSTVATSTPAEETPSAPTSTPTKPATPGTGSGSGSGSTYVPVPQTVTQYVYPQSNPNGYTDLAVTIKEAGALNGYSEYSVTFMVKNIGTKTSGSWSFDGDLPNGEDYTSTQYAGLKPQEYMTFTMTVPLPGYTFAEPRATFTVSVHNDANLENNTARTTKY